MEEIIMQTMQTTCNYCSLGCNFDVTTDGNEITKIIPSKNYPVNKGFSCIKGLNLDKQGVMNSPEAKPRIKDKDGNMLSSLPDRDNHSIDSLAYALDREIYRKRGQSA